MALIKNAQADSLPRKAMVLDLGDLQRQAEAIASEADRRARVMLDDAKKERERLISGATEEGRRLGHQKGFEQGLTEGREKGRAEALAQTKAAADALIKSWETALVRFEAQRDELLADARADVLRLAAVIASRVTKRTIELNPDVVKDQLDAAIRLVIAPTRLVVGVHPDDLALAEQVLPALVQRFAAGADCEVLKDEALAPGSCHIRTDKGDIDASVDAQLSRIVDMLLPGHHS